MFPHNIASGAAIRAAVFVGKKMAEGIYLKIENLFRDLPNERGAVCVNPVTLHEFVQGGSGSDSVTFQKMQAHKALWARQWFCWCGPRGAPLLPLTYDEWEDMRRADGLMCLVGFYARSLAFREWEVHLHPTFEEFACGLLAAQSGLWDLPSRAGREPGVLDRYTPLPLTGMTPGLYWAPPKEHREIQASYERARRRRSI